MGPLMIDVKGCELTAEEEKLLQSPAVGGVILFARNFSSHNQIRQLTEQVHNLRSPKLLIAVDQEGGRVQRFKETFTTLPAMATFGKLYQHNKQQALQAAENTGWLMAVELLEVGVDFSFAPVVDLDFGVSEVIGDRSFGRHVDAVSALANAWIRGMHRAGMACVAKHFPGHGAVKVDSHISLPVDSRKLADLQMEDMIPFERVIDHGANGVMTAHIVYESIDQKPATFSTYWIEKILRQQLGFRGAVFSDDLSMGAVCNDGDIVQRARLALEAGCDMVLICNNHVDALYACANMKNSLSAVSISRLLPFHGKLRNSETFKADKQSAIQLVNTLLSPSDKQFDLDISS